jgi:glucosamine--fructose-6-phosphate aminotransferase (isomerizing)
MTVTRTFREAIHAQPENLKAASAAFHEAVGEVDVAGLCSGTLVFSGIGASAHALIPAMLALRAAGRRAFAVSAAELREVSAAKLGDAFVLVSQSGSSAEVVAALQGIEGAPVVAISAHGDSPLAKAADVWLPLGPMPDTLVATLSYTATLQALGMLCDALLARPVASNSVWDRVADLAAELLAQCDSTIGALAPGFTEIRALDAVGGGAAHASAGETSLLAREALRLPATGMETREYLHGPLEAVAPGLGCVLFGGERELSLATELVSFGATVALLSDTPDGRASGVSTIELPPVPELAAPILQILPVQLLVDRIAQLRGLEIGNLRRQQDDTKVAWWGLNRPA